MALETPENDTQPQGPTTPLARGIFGTCVACIIVALTAVALRFIARWAKRIRLAADDYVILVALVCVICQAAMSIKEVAIGGAGHHASDVYPARLIDFAKMLIGVQIFFAVSLGCVKVSICLFYVRVFEMRSFHKRIAAYTVLGFCIAWCVAAILVPLLLCQPISANWKPSDGHCGSQNPAFISIAAIDIITDICIMVLPLPIILKLHMPWTARLGLVILFSAGLLTMIISALRVYNLSRVDYSDITYTASTSFIWSIVEPTVGLAIACAPMIRSLYGHMFHASQAARSAQTTTAATNHRLSAHKSFHRLHDPEATDHVELGDTRRGDRSARAEGKQYSTSRGFDEPEESDDGQTIKVRTDISVTEGPLR